MKKVIILTLFLLFHYITLSQLSQIDSLEWSFAIHNSGSGPMEGLGLTVLPDSSVVVGGRYGHPVDFDPSPATYYDTPQSGEDPFLARYSKNGDFEWLVSISSHYSPKFIELDADLDGNIFAGGSFFGTDLDFNPNGSPYLLSSTFDANFVTKYDSTGVLNWAFPLSNPSNNNVFNEIEVDRVGNVLVAGEITGPTNFNPLFGSSILNGSGQNAFLAKYSTNGEMIWSHILEGTGYSRINGVTTDDYNNIYVVGMFDSQIDVDPSVGEKLLTPPSGAYYASFIIKYSSTGGLVWAHTIEGSTESRGADIVYGNHSIYVAGNFKGVADINPGAGVDSYTSSDPVPGYADRYLIRLNEDGKYIWGFNTIKAISATLNYSLMNLAWDDNHGVILNGNVFSSDTDFDPSISNTVNLFPTNATGDQFYACYTEDKKLNWIFDTKDSDFDNGNDLEMLGSQLYVLIEASDGIDMSPSNTPSILSDAGICIGKYHIPCQNLNTSDTLNICSGDSIYLENEFRSVNGTYTDTLSVRDGCSKIVETTLYVLPELDTVIAVFTCDSVYISPSGKYTWSTSGIKHDTLQASSCCDSIITIDLEIGYLQPNYDTIKTCQSFDWNGNTYSETGDYTFSTTGSSGCDSSSFLSLIIDTIDLSIVVNNGSLLANAFSDSYQWLDCNALFLDISGEIQNEFSPITSGDFAVEITNGTCTDTSACYFLNTVGLKYTEKKIINTYPNPFNDILMIESNFEISRVTVTDLLGKVIVNKENQTNQLILDLSALNQGLYVLIIEGDNSKLSKLIERL